MVQVPIEVIVLAKRISIKTIVANGAAQRNEGRTEVTMPIDPADLVEKGQAVQVRDRLIAEPNTNADPHEADRQGMDSPVARAKSEARDRRTMIEEVPDVPPRHHAVKMQAKDLRPAVTSCRNHEAENRNGRINADPAAQAEIANEVDMAHNPAEKIHESRRGPMPMDQDDQANDPAADTSHAANPICTQTDPSSRTEAKAFNRNPAHPAPILG
jgi:hypothetical protein